MPLPEYESDKEIISDLVKALLEELDRECWCLGSTTLKKPTEHGLEPDQCFYIQHEAAVRGKKCLDLASDPPPDLALEVDLTSARIWQYTQPCVSLNCGALPKGGCTSLYCGVMTTWKYRKVRRFPDYPCPR